MVVKKLDRNQVTNIPQYSVCAQEKCETSFVSHVGLSSKNQNSRYDESINWIHMRPPFCQDLEKVHLNGYCELSDEEKEKICRFIDLYAEEIDRCQSYHQYVIYPDQTPPSHDISYRRYSCAGFVLDAYEFAGIDLLGDAENFPRVDTEFICKNYGVSSTLLKYFILTGEEPWPITLPGYVLNAFGKPRDKILFEPQMKHAFCSEIS